MFLDTDRGNNSTSDSELYNHPDRNQWNCPTSDNGQVGMVTTYAFIQIR